MPGGVPVITSVSPDHTTALKATPIVISGSHFTGATLVNIGMTACSSLTVVSDTVIHCTSPGKVQGLYDLDVTNGAGTTLKANFFAFGPATPDTRFGLNNGYPTHRLPHLAAGAKWCRQQFNWSDIEPAAPVAGVHTYSWTALDAIVAQAVADGISLRLIFASTPNWAQTRPSCALTSGLCGIDTDANFNAFAGACAARYAGQVDHWEIGNEVTSAAYFEKNDDNPYDAWLIGGGAAIKAANPDATVHLAGLVDPTGLDADILKGMIVTLAKAFADPVAFHIYGHEDDVTTASNYLLTQMRKNEVVRPFEITETAKYCDSADDLATMAQEIVKRHCRGFAAGADAVYHWQLVSLPLRSEDGGTAFPGTAVTGLGWQAKDDTSYLWHSRDAFSAYITMTRMLSGWTEMEAISATAYRFTVASRDVWVCWGSGALPSTIKGKIRLTTHLGTGSSTQADAVTLTTAPVYVTLALADRRNAMTASGAGVAPTEREDATVLVGGF